MYTIRSLREGVGLLAATAILALVLLNLGGCSAALTAPEAEAAEAPALPPASELQAAFGNLAQALNKIPDAPAGDNYRQARLRLEILGASARLVMQDPARAFALAGQSDPVRSDDGSWMWVNRATLGADRGAVILKAWPEADGVRWEMDIISATGPTCRGWIRGTTDRAGGTGRLVLREADGAGNPVCGEITWGLDYREFVKVQQGAGAGRLRLEQRPDGGRITFTRDDGSAPSFISWQNRGGGCIRVPDHNGGRPAFWDAAGKNLNNPG